MHINKFLSDSCSASSKVTTGKIFRAPGKQPSLTSLMHRCCVQHHSFYPMFIKFSVTNFFRQTSLPSQNPILYYIKQTSQFISCKTITTGTAFVFIKIYKVCFKHSVLDSHIMNCVTVNKLAKTW